MRLLAVLAAAASLLSAQAAFAVCEGRDMRETLTAAERADLDRALAGEPFTEGNHWIARRGDTVIHLVGTVHIADPRLAGPVETLRPVVDGARLLLLEMTPDDMEELTRRLQADPGLLVLQGTALPDLMPEADWQRLAEAAQARGIPPVMAAKFQPWYLTLMLAVPTCALGDPRAVEGLDKRLQDIAEASGTDMAALEDVQTVFDIFGEAPLEDQIDMLRASLIADEDGTDLFATLIDAYFDEKPGESWQVTRILARRASAVPPAELDDMYAEMERTLLVARNRAWMPVILDAAGPEPIVVAAGAAHLQGRQGLAALLEGEGFSLERAPF